MESSEIKRRLVVGSIGKTSCGLKATVIKMT